MTGSDDQKPPEAPEAKPDADAEAAAKKAAAEAKAKAAAEAKAKKAAEEAAKPPWERDPAAPEVSEALEHELVRALEAAHSGAIRSAVQRGDELSIDIERDRLVEVCGSLKADQGYHLLVDLCGVDYPDREGGRFEVVYHLDNIETNHRVRLRVIAAEGEEVPSVVGIWKGADWCEREAYDMYGIRFSGHPDMTRILLWEGFHGYPLRKDFPVEGIDTGAAIYPEYYEEEAGPVIGTGTGWKPPEPPEPEPEVSESSEAEAPEGAGT